MNKHIGLWIVFITMIYGCGPDEGSPPILFNLQYRPTAMLVGWGDGSSVIMGTVDFKDPDGDLIYLNLATRECDQGPWKDLPVMPGGMAGRTSGSVGFAVIVSTDCPEGTYMFNVNAFDGGGHQSNTLKAFFELYLD